jgi:HK97 family phage prohead protease
MSAQPITRPRAPEVRTYPAQTLRLVELDANRALSELHGRAVPYGVWTDVGWYEESIRAGAFHKSIREAARSLPLLLWHDNESWPIGVVRSWEDGDDGLDGVWTLDDDERAQRAAKLARDGFLTGLSVGFQPMPTGSHWEFVDEDAWTRGERDRVERTEARLLETSLTPTPAYAGAAVSLVRSADKPHAADRARAPRRGELDHWRTILDELRNR